MTQSRTAPVAPNTNANNVRIPPLENGATLSVAEFEWRFGAMPEVKKAELINGVVYMPSPVTRSHSGPHAEQMCWLGVYKAMTLGIEVGDNGTLRLSVGANQPQPDGYLRILPDYGGQSHDTADGYVGGAPELIAETAVTSANIDLHDKLDVYQQNGVREYVVWRVWDGAIDWFVLRGSQFDPLPIDQNGVYRSEVFPGLWLDAAAMIRRDLAQVLQVLQQGLASPEHVAFVAQIQARAPKP
jgi:hypothetical protein